MPKLVCVCGYVHDLSPIPDHGYLTIRDADYEEHHDALVTSPPGSIDIWGLLYE